MGLTPSSDRLTYTVKEAASVVGIGRTAAYEAVRTGALPSIRIGRRILIPKAALDRWLSTPRPGQGDRDDPHGPSQS